MVAKQPPSSLNKSSEPLLLGGCRQGAQDGSSNQLPNFPVSAVSPFQSLRQTAAQPVSGLKPSRVTTCPASRSLDTSCPGRGPREPAGPLDTLSRGEVGQASAGAAPQTHTETALEPLTSGPCFIVFAFSCSPFD